MKRFIVDPLNVDPVAIAEAADSLRRGGVVAYPTDTLYGLAVDPRSDAAVHKLFRLKGRDTRSAIALIAADLEQAQQAGTFEQPEMQLASAFWPGPLTIVVPMSAGVSSLLSVERGTVGVRVPDHPVARALAREFGRCITATSANVSGRLPSNSADEVAAAMGTFVDVILDGGPAAGGPASTIVQIIGGTPTLHRVGAVAWDRVLRCLQ